MLLADDYVAYIQKKVEDREFIEDHVRERLEQKGVQLSESAFAKLVDDYMVEFKNEVEESLRHSFENVVDRFFKSYRFSERLDYVDSIIIDVPNTEAVAEG
jgi:hypothetical protein